MRALVLSLALGALTGVASLSLGPAIRRPVGHRRCRVCRRMADEVADAADDALDDDEAELIEEAKEIARAKRSNMFNEDGVAYAPWLVDQVDEDAMMAAKAMRSMRKRQERDALEEKDGYVSLTEATTSELSGLGLKVRARARLVLSSEPGLSRRPKACRDVFIRSRALPFRARLDRRNTSATKSSSSGARKTSRRTSASAFRSGGRAARRGRRCARTRTTRL